MAAAGCRGVGKGGNFDLHVRWESENNVTDSLPSGGRVSRRMEYGGTLAGAVGGYGQAEIRVGDQIAPADAGDWCYF